MTHFLVRRLLQALFVVAGVSVVVFAVMRLSGDPTLLLLPPDAPAAEVQRLRQEMGFDQPLYVQYVRYVGGVLQGDLGTSLRFRRPTLGLLLERLPATVQLALAAEVLALAVALPLGVFAAVRRNTVWDRLAMVIAVAGQSIPLFWLGLMLSIVFAVTLRVLPASGYGEWRHLVLPAITLSLFPLARTARLTRSAVLEVLYQDYIRTARAKGLAEQVVLRRHALGNALLPIVTMIALDFGTLLGGAVVTETVFAWPGVGRLTIDAIATRDYPLVQSAVLFLSLVFVGINLLTDLFYTYLDPRIRFA
ncbi:MAG: ABC transporter permease [Planctomycetes bacterium]|nr:ABC transporter permease [Planctomycetota bacterium]